MFSLPTEAKLDVLKCFNFEQLTSFKLTNFYFYNLIKRYEEELCYRMKFYELSINVNLQELDSYKIIEPKPGFVKYILNDLLKEWQAPQVPRSISLLLFDCDRLLEWMKIFSENDGNSLNSLLCIERTLDNLLDNGPRYYILKLPTFPKSFEELAITRYCLQQLLNCVFEYALFDEIVFNPELINLLFNDNKIICPKFYIENPNLFPSKLVSFYNIWEFVSNHLTISYCLTNDFGNGDGLYWGHSNLLDIITMRGYELPKILLRNLKLEWLYHDIVEHIAKSKDCSQMVANISLHYSSPPKFKLNEKSENVEIKQFNGVKYTKYQISNIHNSKTKFSFCNEQGKDGKIVYVKIRKMKV